MKSDLIERSFKSVLGLPCWKVNYDRTLNLSLNFGKPSLDIREPFKTDSKTERVQRMAASRCVTVRGQWWLWMNCCYWRLSSTLYPPVTGSASIRKIELATRHLDGQKLLSVTVHPETGATRFTFDLGCILDCRRIEKDSKSALWFFYQPNGNVLSVSGDGTIGHGK